MTVLFVLVGIAVVLAVGLLSVGKLGELPAAPPDRTPDRIPADGPLEGADLDAVRFDVGFRGYRMDEVDRVLDRVAADLAARDAEIAALHARLGEAGVTLVADEDGEAPAVEAEETVAEDGEVLPVDRRGPVGDATPVVAPTPAGDAPAVVDARPAVDGTPAVDRTPEGGRQTDA